MAWLVRIAVNRSGGALLDRLVPTRIAVATAVRAARPTASTSDGPCGPAAALRLRG